MTIGPARGGPPARRAGRGGRRRPGAPPSAGRRSWPTTSTIPRRARTWRLLRPTRSDVEIDASQTLVSPAGVETLAVPPAARAGARRHRHRLPGARRGPAAGRRAEGVAPAALGLGPIRIAAPLLRRRARRRRGPPPGRRRHLRRGRGRPRRRDGVDRGRDAAAAPARAPGAACRPRSSARPPAACSARSATSTRRGIVHGDLKPSNLLLRAPGAVVLADFGSAGLAGDPRAPRAAPRGRRSTSPPSSSRARPRRRPPISTRSARSSGKPRPGRPLRSHADLMRGGGPERRSPPTSAPRSRRRTAPAYFGSSSSSLGT